MSVFRPGLTRSVESKGTDLSVSNPLTVAALVVTELVTPSTVRLTVRVVADAGAAVVMNAAVSAAVANPTALTFPTMPILPVVCGDVSRPSVRERNM